MNDWNDLVLRTAERFGGTFPHQTTSETIATIHARAPHAVERTIDEVANDYIAGEIRSPWAILKARVEKITADVTPKANASNQRSKIVARAEQWIRNAGMHYDRESEVDEELFGERGLLLDYPDTRNHILELWRQQRPVAQAIDEERAQFYAKRRMQRA